METERTSVQRSVTWSNATQSGEVDLRAQAPAGLYLPSGFVGTALTVQVNVAAEGESADWVNLYDDIGNALTIVVAASRVVALPIACFGLPKIRFVSNQTETATGKLFGMS